MIQSDSRRENSITDYHAKYYAQILTRRGGEGMERLSQSLFDAYFEDINWNNNREEPYRRSEFEKRHVLFQQERELNNIKRIFERNSDD